ncbi:MAG: UbiA family prenyltransferase [Planctomycetaceae bacterium]|nr:UbiA family prenyltransferase [Planctomycetaceae bacterium]
MSPFRAWLQLLRLPAVFTALADIMLGYLLNHATLEEFDPNLALLAGASACLYLAGMVFNDVFDRHIDAQERPSRPIPSQRVKLKAAVTVGVILVVAGVVLAALRGLQSLWIALGIVAAVFLYDGFLKKTPVGPLGMGICRFLNVMLGASAFDDPTSIWTREIGMVAAAMGVYITGVTWFAKQEAEKSRRWPLVGATVIINAGIAMLVASIAMRGEQKFDLQRIIIGFAFMAFILDRRLITTIFDPIPARVQMTVKVLLWTYIILCAAMIFAWTNEPVLAGATVALLVPAVLLGKWIYVT